MKSKLIVFLFSTLYALSASSAFVTSDKNSFARIDGADWINDATNDDQEGLKVVINLGAIGDPAIAYSDIIYGPNSGWSAADPNKGAVVTIWGRNFGSTRGSSYVTVNGVNLTTETSYVDTWAKVDNPTPFMQSITFQLNNTISYGEGEIKVTVDGNTSNGIPFKVGAGAIKFIAPGVSGDGSLLDPINCTDVRNSLSPGDIYYYRAGTYNTACGGTGSVVIYNGFERASVRHATESQPAALVAYPGEVALLDTAAFNDTQAKCVSVLNDYLTVAKFKMDCNESAIQLQGFYSRAVGNDVDGLHDYRNGAGIIGAGNDGARVYGNSVHGGRSARKEDHAIYFSGCTPNDGSEAAYNYIYDNNFDQVTDATGALIVDNHQQDRCESGEIQQTVKIYNNLISCENYPARAIGLFDASYNPGETEPEPYLVYNNIIINCGVSDEIEAYNAPFLYHNEGYAIIFNNTFINSYSGISIDHNSDSGGGVISTVVRNNVFTNASGFTVGSCIGVETSTNGVGDVPIRTVSNNAGASCSLDGTNDVSSVTDMTFNSVLYDPVTVLSTSSLVDMGIDTYEVTVNSVIHPMVIRDFYLTPRTPGSYDIGAIEVIQ